MSKRRSLDVPIELELGAERLDSIQSTGDPNILTVRVGYDLREHTTDSEVHVQAHVPVRYSREKTISDVKLDAIRMAREVISLIATRYS